MTHAFKLGPVETEEGLFQAYLAVGDGGLDIANGPDDERALRELMLRGKSLSGVKFKKCHAGSETLAVRPAAQRPEAA